MKLRFVTFSALLLATACGGATTATQNDAAATDVNQPNANNQIAVVNANAANGETPAPNSKEVPVYETADAAIVGGKEFFEADEDEKAAESFEQAVKLDKNNPEAHFQLAVAYATLDRTEDSEKSFNEAIKIFEKQTKKEPKNAIAFFNLGRAYNKINEDQKAQKALQQAAKLQPDDSEIRFELGNVLIKLALYEQAVKELKKVLELDPENSRAQMALEKAEAGDIRVKDAQKQNKKEAAAKQAAAKTAAPRSKSGGKTATDANATTSAPPAPPAGNSNQ